MNNSPQILALMALMREIEKPSACYNRAVRRAAQTLTDSPENDAAQVRGNAALLEIEQAVRTWIAKHPAPEQPPGGLTTRVCAQCWTGIHWDNGLWAHDESKAHTPFPPPLPVVPTA